MDTQKWIAELTNTERYFVKSINTLTEEDSTFAPKEGLMTVAQHIAHVAHTVDWFVEGANRAEGFDLDFPAHWQEISKVSSVQAAKEWVTKAFRGAREMFEKESAEELSRALPEGMVMGGQPRYAIVGSIVDHTAHHRGSLAVYARLLGHEPEMPY